MIVATAGHISHGKSSLVRALTGVDPDRLPEEKRRRLTIDLGFAYQPLAEGRVLGFVDVPGHERFVRAMAAGVAAVDAALLVIAADDGPMPQTIEHLAIIDLLGIGRGLVALTKTDRVASERVDAVVDEIAALLRGTGLDGACIIGVSNLTGEGLDNLVVALERLAVECAARPVGGNFRLAVDRRFTLPGAGLVVTGAAIAGRVRTGDRLLLSPQGLPVRVRGLRVQNELAQVGAAGDRCALNLAGAGVHKSAVHRGDWVVAAAAHAPTDRLDACFRLLATEARPLRNSTPVHLHLGAAHLTARVAVLEGRSIPPGGAAPVQLVLDRAIGALRGDRFVLRDAAARHTIGGGVVLDSFPPARGRARPERLTVLAAQAREDPAAALGELLAQTPGGVDLGWFRAAWNLTDAEGAALWTRAGVVRTGDARGSAGFTPGHWVALKNTLLETVGYWHERSPQVLGLNEDALRRALPLRVAPAALEVAIRQLVGAGFLARHGTIVHLPGHRIRPTPAEAAAWARVRPLLEAGGLRPPLVWQLAEALGEEADAIQRFLVRAAELGLVLRVTEKRFFPPPAIAQLAAIAEAVAAAEPDGLFTAAAYRDAANVGRNLSISLLEYFDRAGLTQRIGEGRRLLRSVAELFAMGENEAPAEDAEGAC